MFQDLQPLSGTYVVPIFERWLDLMVGGIYQTFPQKIFGFGNLDLVQVSTWLILESYHLENRQFFLGTKRAWFLTTRTNLADFFL